MNYGWSVIKDQRNGLNSQIIWQQLLKAKNVCFLWREEKIYITDLNIYLTNTKNSSRVLCFAGSASIKLQHHQSATESIPHSSPRTTAVATLHVMRSHRALKAYSREFMTILVNCCAGEPCLFLRNVSNKIIYWGKEREKVCDCLSPLTWTCNIFRRCFFFFFFLLLSFWLDLTWLLLWANDLHKD